MIKEQNKAKNGINWFVFSEIITCIAMVWFTCVELPELASLVFAISLLILLFAFVKYLFLNAHNLDSLDTYLIIIIALSFFNVVLSFVYSDKEVAFENLKPYFLFLSTIIFFRLAEKIRISKKMCNIVFILNIVISVIYQYIKIANPDSMDLNFSSANLAGMFLLVSVVYMIMAFIFYKHIVMKLITAALAVGNFLIMYETQARNVLLAFVLFLVIVLLTLFKGGVRYSKVFNFIVNATPSIFIVIYLSFIDKVVLSGKLNFLVSEGKDLTSRVSIWREFLGKMDGMWLTGDYANASGNAHNSHLVLLCSFGIFVLVLTTLYLYKLIDRVSNNITNKFQTYCVAAFFACIFTGFGEGALYSGGLGLYILFGTFIVLANSEFEGFSIKKAETRP